MGGVSIYLLICRASQFLKDSSVDIWSQLRYGMYIGQGRQLGASPTQTDT